MNDRSWSDIFVPADWENEGFPGYDGYAWYRKHFTLSASVENNTVLLSLGFVDDVCAVYVNGHIVGESGRFPPRFETAYNQELKFTIPKKYLNLKSDNVIAVRVYDDRLNGGIVSGKIGLFIAENTMNLVVAFPDLWKFNAGDSRGWSDPSFDDSRWKELIVPALWDFQGYRDYDGFGWYRVTFDLPASMPAGDLVLMLGRIDDIDEAYLNGELIGSTGRIREDGSVARIREEYREMRAYDIPRSALKPGRKNLLAVRVYDNFQLGGIYEGPVGIVTKSESRKWFRNNDGRWKWDLSPIDRLIEQLFNNK